MTPWITFLNTRKECKRKPATSCLSVCVHTFLVHSTQPWETSWETCASGHMPDHKAGNRLGNKLDNTLLPIKFGRWWQILEVRTPKVCSYLGKSGNQDETGRNWEHFKKNVLGAEFCWTSLNFASKELWGTPWPGRRCFAQQAHPGGPMKLVRISQSDFSNADFPFLLKVKVNQNHINQNDWLIFIKHHET